MTCDAAGYSQNKQQIGDAIDVTNCGGQLWNPSVMGEDAHHHRKIIIRERDHVSRLNSHHTHV